jgi:hypothetical protein
MSLEFSERGLFSHFSRKFIARSSRRLRNFENMDFIQFGLQFFNHLPVCDSIVQLFTKASYLLRISI